MFCEITYVLDIKYYLLLSCVAFEDDYIIFEEGLVIELRDSARKDESTKTRAGVRRITKYYYMANTRLAGAYYEDAGLANVFCYI